MLNKKNILVIGAKSFLAKEFLEQSINKTEFRIFGTTRQESSSYVKFDIFDLRKSIKKIESLDIDIVVNFAWNTNQNYQSSNLNIQHFESEIAFFEQISQIGINHYISMGSGIEKFQSKDTLKTQINSYKSNNYYSFFKNRTCVSLQQLAENTDTKLSWVRVFQPYGPHQDSHRFAQYVLQNLMSEKGIIVKNPYVQNDWITTRDVSLGIWKIITDQLTGIIELGTGIATSNKDFCLTIANVLNRNSKLIHFQNSNINNKIVADIKSNILYETGWKPNDDLESGIIWTIQNA